MCSKIGGENPRIIIKFATTTSMGQMIISVEKHEKTAERESCFTTYISKCDPILVDFREYVDKIHVRSVEVEGIRCYIPILER